MTRRGLPTGLAVLALSAAGFSGCGHGTVSYGSAVMAGRLAGTVRSAVQDAGYPIVDDHVGCGPPNTAGVVTCYATTTDEPTTEVRATFTPTGQGCAGLLEIALAGAPLRPRTTDPCR